MAQLISNSKKTVPLIKAKALRETAGMAGTSFGEAFRVQGSVFRVQGSGFSVQGCIRETLNAEP